MLTRTNSESILGAIAPDTSTDYSHGVAITSSFHPDEDTHIEPVRYGKGSNLMSLLQTVLTDGDGPAPALADLAEGAVAREAATSRTSTTCGTGPSGPSSPWSCRASTTRSRLKATKRLRPLPPDLASRATAQPNPTWIPVANEAVRRLAGVMGGTAGGSIGEPFNRPMTAHFIGGCTIGDSPETGVVDPYQRVYGYPGLHVADGSAISANLGVNPSLTITAQAERAMAFWPNKGEADPRPALGEHYLPVPPVAPAHPVVPAAAPAALRLPIVGIR